MGRTENFLDNPRLQEFQRRIREGEDLVVEEIWDAPKALLTTLAQETTEKQIVIITGGVRENRLFEDFPYFGKEAIEFPAWETLPNEEVPPSPDIVGERYKVLKSLDKQQIILTTLQAVLQRLLSPEWLDILHLELKTGAEFPFEELPHRLTEMGYHRHAVAADKGEFSVRGGIVDLFPVSSPDPVRIEFWGDEIASIRKYDPIGQKSVGKVEQITVTPGEELELLNEQADLATLFDYLGPNTLVIFDDIAAIEDKYVELKKMTSKSFASFEALMETLAPLQRLYFLDSTLNEISHVRPKGGEVEFEAFNLKWWAHRFRHPFAPLLPSFCPPDLPIEDFSQEDFLAVIREQKIPAHFLCQHPSEERFLKEHLEEPTIEKGYLSSGFYLHTPNLALIPMPELTHRYKVRRQKQRSHYHTLPVEMLSLTPGEAVVHMNNGIGRYLGIERRKNHLGVETEYMLVEYAGGSKLYVPMEQANLVSKYIGGADEKPELHALGSNKWVRARERTQKAIMGYATDLLRVQAEREIKGGYAYPSDSELFTQFEEEFPYVETPDQLAAIDTIRNEMTSERLVDRLVCGDVGYGKTEVAMRAAFKAVVDGGKQVAVLVPTTVLAMQHYETFCERMANFPITVAVLSRFRKPKEVKQTLEETARGVVDILVGTHRIVSKDVVFKDLGLVIIDEEQRFGVRAKEHLKKIKHEIDCVTLSATPIPRTLYMSLVGARDLSVINTPPEDRLPIQSFVCQGNDELLKQALQRELARDGQSYLVHNRVETIFEYAGRIQKLVPTAKIVVGHGQMGAQELDGVFHAFKSGEADILVATSIIENGIDIPNANTILIDRADRFGLADLYQMRGRVGRWNRKAYCYFLVPNTRELSEISRKRLSALTQSSGHGGGMKIAMHDLEIRGAGNILGTEQSGHVSAIGFHLYCKMLKKTINSLKKNDQMLLYHEVKIEFPYDARLPEHYVNETTLRMELYGRLGDAESAEEIDALIDEIRDRFGPPPIEVEWLRSLSKIRVFAAKNRFTLLKLTKTVLTAEQSHGKKNKITKKILLKPPTTPEALETTLIQTLKSNFPSPQSKL